MKARKISKIFILAIFFLPIFLMTGLANNNHEAGAFNRGNVYYEQGDFDEAIKQYKSIFESGLESGNLYYNLGNCYFKKGKLGEAIFYYEKGRRLIPQDKDLKFNYEYACSLIKGGSVIAKTGLPLRLWNSFFEKTTIDGLVIFLGIFFIAILITILAGLFFKTVKKQILIFAVFLGLCFIAGIVGLKGKISLLNKEAIIVVEQADVKFEPMDKATTYFTLYEGRKVKILESRDNWYKVKRQDGKAGWVQYGALSPF